MPHLQFLPMAAAAALASLCLIVWPAGAVPPPVEQLSANCLAPTYASDMLVCTTPELMALDDAMQPLLAGTGDKATSPLSPLIEPQADWLRRRSLCAMQRSHAACLQAAYGERIAVLRGLSGMADVSDPAFDCSGTGGLDGVRAILGEDGSAVLFLHAQVVAVGIWRSDRKSWRPFVDIARSGKRLAIESQTSDRARCSRVNV